MNSPDAFLKPVFQVTSAAAGRQEVNTEPDFAQDDRVNDDLTLVEAEPFDHAPVRLRLR